MRFDWWTFALQTLNFAVLVWLLHRFLYKPVLRLVDSRAKALANEFATAGAAKKEAAAQLAATAADRAAIAAERDKLLKAARAQAEEEAETRRQQAEHEAAAMVEAARKALVAEREEALTQARSAALDLGVDVARRLLDLIPPALRAEAWIEQIEGHLANIPASDHDQLFRDLGNGSTLRVVTAAPLPEAVQKDWRGRLDLALKDGFTITFDVDPALVAGAELHFPSSILRFSWRSALAAMRAEIGSHDHTR